MSWIHRFNRMLARGTPSVKGADSVPATPPAKPAKDLVPESPPPEPRPKRKPKAAASAGASKRPVSPHLASRAAAVKAVAEAMRKAHNQAEAAANARAVLARMGVKIPAPQAPVPLLWGERKSLIAEAMSHWARGHAIYENLDPHLKERVRQLAERMAPK